MSFRQMAYTPLIGPDTPQDSQLLKHLPVQILFSNALLVGMETAAIAVGLAIRRASFITHPIDDLLMLALQHQTVGQSTYR